MKKRDKFKIVIGILVASLVFFVGLGVLTAAVYKYNSGNRLVRMAERIFPFPAVYISGNGIIKVEEIKDNTASVKKFYESQDFEKLGLRVDFGTEQGKKRLKIKEKEVLNKMIENEIVEGLAKREGIRVSDATVSSQVNQSIEQFGNREKLMSELARLYGWTILDFQEHVVRPELYARRLEQIYLDEIDTSDEEKKINELWERVSKSKENFDEAARQFSEGASAKDGGDLGWSSRDQLIEPIAETAFSMKIGEMSEVISSPLGFHIIKLEEKKDEDGEELAHIRQIFVKKTTFGDWLQEKVKEHRIIVFLRDYRWNSDDGRVEFTDPGMIEFEKNTALHSQGDPSVFP